MTAMETMASIKTTSVAAAEAVATTTEAAPVPTATGSHQDELIACCIQRLCLLGAAKIARLCERANSGKRKRKCAEKARRDWTVFHRCTPFACVLCKSRSPDARSPSMTKRVVRAGAAFKLRVDEGLE
jgi:hypothetical protein